ncbi:hypothetical protein MPSEU_000013300 [Mayamaea pseudoterrestris]|nr:hypothetical protein MPSEU_000013300 [Mayamaea pseudoterrestris]
MSNLLMQRLQSIQLFNRMQQRYHETIRIALTTRQLGDIKAALLQEARSSSSTNAATSMPSNGVNQTAISLLRVEQQWSLMKYHGVAEYCRTVWAQHKVNQQRLLYNSSGFDIGSNSESPSADIAPSHSSSPASLSSSSNNSKIAVMITNRMKHALIHDLNYHEKEQINKLTPLQASLILQHNLKAPPLLKNDDTNDDHVLEQVQTFQHRLAELERNHYDQEERMRDLQAQSIAAAQQESETLAASKAVEADERGRVEEQPNAARTAADDSNVLSKAPSQINNESAAVVNKPRLSPLSFLSASASRNVLAVKEKSNETSTLATDNAETSTSATGSISMGVATDKKAV